MDADFVTWGHAATGFGWKMKEQGRGDTKICQFHNNLFICSFAVGRSGILSNVKSRPMYHTFQSNQICRLLKRTKSPWMGMPE
jgi:hypothetical protein